MRKEREKDYKCMPRSKSVTKWVKNNHRKGNDNEDWRKQKSLEFPGNHHQTLLSFFLHHNRETFSSWWSRNPLDSFVGRDKGTKGFSFRLNILFILLHHWLRVYQGFPSSLTFVFPVVAPFELLNPHPSKWLGRERDRKSISQKFNRELKHSSLTSYPWLWIIEWDLAQFIHHLHLRWSSLPTSWCRFCFPALELQKPWFATVSVKNRGQD
jgi:hypothetical protein